MKILKVLFSLFIFLITTESQIIFKITGVDNNSVGIANAFEKQLGNNLNQTYYTVQIDDAFISEEDAKAEIRNYFKSEISNEFSPQVIKIEMGVSVTSNNDNFINFKVNISNAISNSVIISFSEEYVNISKITETGDYIVQIIKNVVPAYSKINSVNDLNQLEITYGWDRDAKEGESLDLIELDSKSIIGQLKIIQVSSEQSICDIEAELGKTSFNKSQISNYIVQTKKDDKEVDKYIKKIASLSEKQNLPVRSMPQNRVTKTAAVGQNWVQEEETPSVPNNWLIITYQNLAIDDDYFEMYFPSSPLAFSAPATFSMQINFSSSVVRPFFKGRFSLKSENALKYPGLYPPVLIETSSQPLLIEKSKLRYYQVGLGMAGQISIKDIAYVIPSICAYYSSFNLENSFYYENDPTNYQLIANLSKKVEFRGLGIELCLGLMGRYKEAAVYIEFGYHMFPLLKANESKTNYNTNAISSGFGVSYFF